MVIEKNDLAKITAIYSRRYDGKQGQMAMAAVCYIEGTSTARASKLWPWNEKWWKPTDRRRRVRGRASA